MVRLPTMFGTYVQLHGTFTLLIWENFRSNYKYYPLFYCLSDVKKEGTTNRSSKKEEKTLHQGNSASGTPPLHFPDATRKSQHKTNCKRN
ncbi:MAG: hypothetical protein LBD45_03315 [Bacteroidales bacterium]|nr:hypothetical protein [Bacteroidales bacterium]